MSVELIKQRLALYKINTVLDQENAHKEIAQEIALMALSRSGLFRVAAFQGGTCLRILYGLQRFSEDLDFVLLNTDQRFDWKMYVEHMQEEFDAYGYTLSVTIKSRLEKAIQSAFLKADSQGGILVVKDNRTNRPKLQIKLEVDTNPPAGSQFELKYLDFPMPFSVQTQNLPSLFASKCHALLCREYVKGRDWYDFSWYVTGKNRINFQLLSHALDQAGPWAGKNIVVASDWLVNALNLKIDKIDWAAAKQDVARFLNAQESPSLDLWSADFFHSRMDKLAGYLPKS